MTEHEKQQRLAYDTLMSQLEQEYREQVEYLRCLALNIPTPPNLRVPDDLKKRADAARIHFAP